MAHEHPLGLRSLLAAILLICGAQQAAALVGTADPADGDTASHFVMVLARTGEAAGFCTGIVLAPTLVLTAAHCVGTPADTRVHLADARAAALLPVAAIARHPLYRSDAVRTRQRSIDLALLRLATPLPPPFAATPLAADAPATVGTSAILVGFGLSDERAPRTGGSLRRGRAHVRAPQSEVLLWMDGPAYGCTGDSGGGVLDPQTGALIGVIAWAQGTGRTCGALTQAVRLATARPWIDEMRTSWRP